MYEQSDQHRIRLYMCKNKPPFWVMYVGGWFMYLYSNGLVFKNMQIMHSGRNNQITTTKSPSFKHTPGYLIILAI